MHLDDGSSHLATWEMVGRGFLFTTHVHTVTHTDRREIKPRIDLDDGIDAGKGEMTTVKWHAIDPCRSLVGTCCLYDSDLIERWAAGRKQKGDVQYGGTAGLAWPYGTPTCPWRYRSQRDRLSWAYISYGILCLFASLVRLYLQKLRITVHWLTSRLLL